MSFSFRDKLSNSPCVGFQPSSSSFEGSPYDKHRVGLSRHQKLIAYYPFPENINQTNIRYNATRVKETSLSKGESNLLNPINQYIKLTPQSLDIIFMIRKIRRLRVNRSKVLCFYRKNARCQRNLGFQKGDDFLHSGGSKGLSVYVWIAFHCWFHVGFGLINSFQMCISCWCWFILRVKLHSEGTQSMDRFSMCFVFCCSTHVMVFFLKKFHRRFSPPEKFT